MVKIDDTVAMPSVATKKKVETQRSVNIVIKKYQDMHRAVYGRTPRVIYQNPWLKIDTQTTRVTVSRLKEMARQLEARLL